jgi:hypothetical protein
MVELEAVRLHIGDLLDGMKDSEQAQEKMSAGSPQAHIHQEETAR